jgi:hypothetical protein
MNVKTDSYRGLQGANCHIRELTEFQDFAMADRSRSSNVIHFPRRDAPVEDDYRERMKCNLIALAFTSTLFLASC